MTKSKLKGITVCNSTQFETIEKDEDKIYLVTDSEAQDSYKRGEIRTIYDPNVDLGDKWIPCDGSTNIPPEYAGLNTGFTRSSVLIEGIISSGNVTFVGSSIYYTIYNDTSFTLYYTNPIGSGFYQRVYNVNRNYSQISYDHLHNTLLLTGPSDGNIGIIDLSTLALSYRTISGAGYLRRIMFDGKEFSVVDSNLNTFTSTDAVQWINGDHIGFNQLFYTGDNYIGYKSINKKIYLFKDFNSSITEYSIPSTITNSNPPLLYGNGRLIIFSDTELLIYITSDFVNYEKYPLPFLDRFAGSKLKFSGDKFFAGDNTFGNKFYYSTDCINWAVQEYSLSFTNRFSNFSNVCYHKVLKEYYIFFEATSKTSSIQADSASCYRYKEAIPFIPNSYIKIKD